MRLMDDAKTREWVARTDLTYEVHALWSTALEQSQLTTARSQFDVRASNAFIEACLVHARLIADFLDTKPSGRYEDATASHYSPSWSTRHTLTPSELDRINWTIMHLSAERRRITGGIDLVDTAERILNVLNNFIATIPDDEVRSWFDPCRLEILTFQRERSALEKAGKLPRLVSTTNATTSTSTSLQKPRGK